MVSNKFSDNDFDPDDDGPADTIEALIDLNHPALQDVLAEVITHPSKAVRRAATFRLAELFQDVRAVPVLAEALDDPDRRVRKSASEALWDIGDADTRGMIAFLTQAHGQERDLIAAALLTALNDPDGAVRRAGSWALGQIGDPQAVEGLAGLLGDLEGGMFGVGDRVCDIAGEALQRISTPEAMAALSQWQAEVGGDPTAR
jgi:HEAT repeat protein